MARRSENGEVIVIGGGIAGLAAARELARQGRAVRLLEARSRLGGRILTLRPDGWPVPVELGAQFVHGGNPPFWRLLRAKRLRTAPVSELHWRPGPSGLELFPDAFERVGRVTALIKPTRAGGKSFAGYFARYPAKVDPLDWKLARGFVEGFEAARLDQISARSLAGDSGAEEGQYHLPQGYDRVIEALAADCRRLGVQIQLRSVVSSVRWSPGSVEIRARRQTFRAAAAVITLPLGVLQARTGRGAVRFVPELGRTRLVINRLRMGHVQRLVFRFKPEAWRRLFAGALRRGRGRIGFVQSLEKGFPVWWSLSADPVLVGWAGGPNATALGRLGARGRRIRAIKNLAAILGVAPRVVSSAVQDCQSWDWSADPFSRGGYSFIAASADDGGTRLARPLRHTLYFAGEATAAGPEVGTVHGAFASGLRAARSLATGK